MMWRRSLSRPGIRRLAGREPVLARLPALPGARGEAEDLDLDAAALERARQDVGAGRRDRDRPAAHRAGIVEQQRHHGVAEVGVLLVLERQRMQRIDDDARQPRRVEHALLEVELPGAVLLRQQPALQPVGEPRHHALQVRELLVEVAAQALQLLRLAQVLGRRSSRRIAGERPVVGSARLVLRRDGAAATARSALSASPISASSGMSAESASSASVALSGNRRPDISASSSVMPSASSDSLASPSPADSSSRPWSVAALVLLVLRVAAALVAHVERVEQVVHRIGEAALVLDHLLEPVEIAAGAVLDPRPPQLDQLARRRRRRLAGQPLAHHQRHRVLDRRVGPVGDLVEIAAVEAVLQHGARDCRATPSMRRAPIASTRACSTASNTARACWPPGSSAAMDRRSWQASRSAIASAWPRMIAASCGVSLRGGSGSRTLPPARPGRSAA